MTDSLSADGVTPPRGWYPDPHTPGRDRWWTGSEWSTATARTPRSLFGTNYARSNRPGPDPAARIANASSIAAIVIALVLAVVAALPGAGVWTTVVVVLLVVSAVVGLVSGIVGLVRSPVHGGRSVSLTAVVVSSIVLLVVASSAAGALTAGHALGALDGYLAVLD